MVWVFVWSEVKSLSLMSDSLRPMDCILLLRNFRHTFIHLLKKYSNFILRWLLTAVDKWRVLIPIRLSFQSRKYLIPLLIFNNKLLKKIKHNKLLNQIRLIKNWLYWLKCLFHSIVVVQLLSCVWFFATPWTTARQASLSITSSRSLLKLMSIIYDAIQAFHPLLHPFPPALNLSQYQDLFQWVGFSHQVTSTQKDERC